MKTECGIEARAALGFRKTFLVLADRKDMLVEMNVAPSVAMLVACAKPEERERALAAIASGRSLTVSETEQLVKVEDAGRASRPMQTVESVSLATRAVRDSTLDRDPILGGLDLAATAGPVPAQSRGIRSTSSFFHHGLTAFEICAGAGGQAAAKAIESARES